MHSGLRYPVGMNFYGLMTTALIGAAMAVSRLQAAVPSTNLLDERMTDNYTEPTVPAAGPSPLWGLALMFLLTAAIVAVSLMPSKREMES